MSVKELMVKWEEALAEALTNQSEQELEVSERDSEAGAGVVVRAHVKAGVTWGPCDGNESWC